MLKHLFIILLMMISGSIFAQKSSVSAAWNHFKYDELDQAKLFIDQAATNPTSADMAKTWYYRGMIYQTIYQHKVFGNLDSDPLAVAFDAYKKCLLLDSKNEYSAEINTKIRAVAFNSGVEEYRNKEYLKALDAFEFIINRHKEDTLAYLYAAYSADYSLKSEKAVSYYKRLIELNYQESNPEKSNIYNELALVYKSQLHDTTAALEILNQGRIIYPQATNLLREEANLYILTGRYMESVSRLEEAIKKSPNEASLHVSLAGILEALATSGEANEKTGLDKNAKEKLIKNAEEHYKNAIQLDPTIFEANYNLGALYFNQGADLMSAANNMKSDSDYQLTKKKAEDRFKVALPYLEKAQQIAPVDEGVLTSLKQIYIRLGDTEKYNRVKAQLDVLK